MEFLHSKREMPDPPGLIIGKVVANYDEKFKGMVQVAFYSYEGNSNITDWMRVSSAMSGKGRGFYILPEVGDEVIVAFINNDPENPCVIGTLWNEKDGYPENAVSDKNIHKLLVTKSGVKITISDEKGKEGISVATPQNIEINLNDENDNIEVTSAKKDNKIIIDGKSGDITVQSQNKLTIRSKEVQIKADTKLSLDSQQIEIKGMSSLKLQSSGITEVNGSMVKIDG